MGLNAFVLDAGEAKTVEPQQLKLKVLLPSS